MVIRWITVQTIDFDSLVVWTVIRLIKWWAMIRLLFVIWMRYDFGPLFVSIIRNIFCADKVLMPNHSSSWSSDESQFRQLTLIRWLVVWTMIRLLFVIWMRYDFGALFVSIIRNIFCADKVLMPNHSPSWSSDESQFRQLTLIRWLSELWFVWLNDGLWFGCCLIFGWDTILSRCL